MLDRKGATLLSAATGLVVAVTLLTTVPVAAQEHVRIKIANSKGHRLFLVCDGEGDSMFYFPFLRTKPYLQVVEEGTYGCMCFDYEKVRNLGTARQSRPFGQFAFTFLKSDDASGFSDTDFDVDRCYPPPKPPEKNLGPMSCDEVECPTWVLRWEIGPIKKADGTLALASTAYAGDDAGVEFRIVRSREFSQQGADAKARQNMAAVLRIYRWLLLIDYLRALKPEQREAEIETLQRPMQAFIDQLMAQAKLVERWRHPNGAYCSLSLTGLADIKTAIRQTPGLSDALRKHMLSNAEVPLEAAKR